MHSIMRQPLISKVSSYFAGLKVTHSVSQELQHFVPPTSIQLAVHTSPLV